MRSVLFSEYFRALSAGKKLALVGVFAALSVVVNCFSIDVTASNKIAFTYALCFFAGYLLGGAPAFLVALFGDAMGYLVNPVGVYFLFGATLGVYALLVGIVMNLGFGEGRGAAYAKAAIALAAGYVCVTVVLNSAVNYWYVCLFVWEGAVKKTFWVYYAGRISFQSIVYAVNAAICFAALPVMLRIDRRGKKRKLSAPEAPGDDAAARRG